MSTNPTWLIRYTTDDASDATPSWTTVANADVRSVTVSRGRESELARVEAGTAELILNNRTRTYDPTVATGLKPMNRWWIQAVHLAVTYDVFFGYAEAYEQSWPATGKDSITVVRLVDEFKVLALDSLPTTDPPRDTYYDLVSFDGLSGYWPFLDPNYAAATVGVPFIPTGFTAGFPVFATEGAIVGQADGGYIVFTGSDFMLSDTMSVGGSGDFGGLSEFAFEGWFAIDGAPASDEFLLVGPLASGANLQYSIKVLTTRKIRVVVRNAAGTNFTLDSTTAMTSAAIPNQVWYHVVATVTGGSFRLYINGTQEASTAFTAPVATMTSTNTVLGNNGSSVGANSRFFDELANYRVGLTAARVTAHYNAGRLRGYSRGELPGDRIDSVLDDSTSLAARSIQTGTREMSPAYMTGQSPLAEIRNAEAADAVDAFLFIACDGTITFLADGHRSSSPYNTVQATFDDDGTDVPYQTVTVEKTDSFIANEWNVTRAGGSTVTASDATSIGKYFKRPQSLTDLPIRDDADQTAIAAAMLAKYKDPMDRIPGIVLALKNDTVTVAALARDLGDRVRIFRTHPNGGARIDQTSFIQKIDLTAVPGKPWQIRFGVSPL